MSDHTIGNTDSSCHIYVLILTLPNHVSLLLSVKMKEMEDKTRNLVLIVSLLVEN